MTNFMSEGVRIVGDPDMLTDMGRNVKGAKKRYLRSLPVVGKRDGSKERLVATGPGPAILESPAIGLGDSLVESGLATGYEVDLKTGKMVVVQKNR